MICLNLVLKLEWSVSVSSPQGPCFIFYFIISDQNILSTKRCLCFSSSQNYRKTWNHNTKCTTISQLVSSQYLFIEIKHVSPSNKNYQTYTVLCFYLLFRPTCIHINISSKYAYVIQYSQLKSQDLCDELITFIDHPRLWDQHNLWVAQHMGELVLRQRI